MSTLVLKQTIGFLLTLQSENSVIRVETSSSYSLQLILKELKRLSNTAKIRKYSAKGDNHKWIQYYTDLNQSDDKKNLSTNETVNNPFIVGSTSDPSQFRTIKDAWISKELRARESEFTEFRPIQILTMTWNVKGKSPSQSIASCLKTPGQSMPDIYAVGLQEIDLSTEAFMFYDATKDAEWTTAISLSLDDESENYSRLASKQLIGMLLIIFVKNEYLTRISDISFESVGTGILGMMGNKGGVAIRFKIDDTFICFVNSHLAADTMMIDRRNQDFQEISKRILFPLPLKYKDHFSYRKTFPWVSNVFDIYNPDTIALENGTIPQSPLTALGMGSKLTIFDCDHLIWMGDLNYRINLTEPEARQLIESENFAELLKFDQLSIERAANRTFQNFEEGSKAFPPTYKFDVGTNNYDLNRCPSWTDRILWLINPLHKKDQDWLTLQWYRPGMDMVVSDHKPVMALMKAQVRKIVAEKFQQTSEAIIRELDTFENNALPNLAISSNELQFGSIRFGVPVTRKIQIDNIGKVTASFKFVNNENTPTKSWLFVNPSSGTLLQGESITLKFTILVEQFDAHQLNFDRDNLSNILILHVDNSKDHFVLVEGTWECSAFGNDLSVLCSLKKLVREAGVAGLKEILNTGAVQSEDMKISVPKEIWRMIDFLMKYATVVDNLFEEPGDRKLMEYLRECIDTEAEFDDALLLADPKDERVESSDIDSGSVTPVEDRKISEEVLKESPIDVEALINGASVIAAFKPKGRAIAVHSMAETLIHFLNSLVDPIIPSALYNKCIYEGYQSSIAANAILKSGMSELNFTIFAYITGFLKELIESYSGRGEVSSNRVAEIFAPILLRPPKGSEGGPASTRPVFSPRTASLSPDSTVGLKNRPLPTNAQPPPLPPRPSAKVDSTKVGTSKTTQLIGGGTGTFASSVQTNVAPNESLTIASRRVIFLKWFLERE